MTVKQAVGEQTRLALINLQKNLSLFFNDKNIQE